MIHDDEASEPLGRISTGNPQADEILGGGFPASSLNILMGLPGTGKTIFAEQMVFHNAEDSRPILYLTTLSEPLPKLVRYLQQFPFFDERKLGGSVRYEDAGAAIAKDGPGALVQRVQEAIADSDPKMIVVDSFKALHDLSASMPEMRRLLYELTGLLTAYETTVFLIGEYTDDQIATLPEFAIADGIVQFSRAEGSNKDERFVRVRKLRGSGYKEGRHAFRIGPGGLEVFPRLTSPELPEGYRVSERRLGTGTEGLDAMLGGGLRAGSSTLVAGGSGAGKTTIGLCFALEGLRRGEECLYINFQENPSELAFVIRGLDARVDAEARRLLHLLYRSPVELQIDSILVEVFRLIDGGKIRRLVLDSVGDLATAAGDSQRLHDYLYALVQHLAVREVTSMLIIETNSVINGGASVVDSRVSYMSSNILLLEMLAQERVRRTVRVVKARGTPHDPCIRELDMSAEGIRVR